jgi:hypothetical protein
LICIAEGKDCIVCKGTAIADTSIGISAAIKARSNGITTPLKTVLVNTDDTGRVCIVSFRAKTLRLSRTDQQYKNQQVSIQ